MANPALETLSRNERRLLLSAEARNRKTGEWGSWETITFPQGTVGKGWTFTITTCHKNKVFSVLERRV